MIKYKTWEEYLLKQVRNGSIYLWGGQGENLTILTDIYIKAKETSLANAKRVIALRDKRIKQGFKDLKAFDCSGLGVFELMLEGVLSHDTTAHGLYNKCEKIKKTAIRPGDFVFRVDGEGHAYHIGYVVSQDLDGNKGTYVVESHGRDVGVVLTTVNKYGASYWNAAGRTAWIEEYNEVYDFTFTRNLKKGMKGEDVKALQKLLNINGFDCGSVDGDFGKNTRKAVLACQKDHKLTRDGVAGRNTIKALGGRWKS